MAEDIVTTTSGARWALDTVGVDMSDRYGVHLKLVQMECQLQLQNKNIIKGKKNVPLVC